MWSGCGRREDIIVMKGLSFDAILTLGKFVKAQSFPVDMVWKYGKWKSIPIALGGHGSQVIKITDSWLMCHEFEPSTTEDPPYRGTMHVKSVESSNILLLMWY
ncbi:hypothetical protein TNCV_4806801 [Trichonephila clavipes]|nr:hypothetical protein TNCV_4806801 [Trichonephila clavipes]